MASYQPVIHETAQRELQQLPHDDAERLKEVIRDVASTEEITTHSKVKPLEGQRGMHRVRVNNLRAIVTLAKPSLCVIAVGTRNSLYDGIDETISQRRASL